jgi:hypothetical protein
MKNKLQNNKTSKLTTKETKKASINKPIKVKKNLTTTAKDALKNKKAPTKPVGNYVKM